MIKKNILVAQIGAGSARDTLYNIFKSSDYEQETYQKTNEKKEPVNAGYPFLVYEQKIDAIILAGTNGSKWKCLCEKIGNKEINEEYTELDKNTVLKKKVEDYLSESLNNIPVKIIVMKNGITEEEIRENCYTLKGELKTLIDDNLLSGQNTGITEESEKPQINIAFDISNGFRSFPMLIYATINYISAIEKKYHFSFSMYYGVYDSKVIKLKEAKTGVDIFKLPVTDKEKDKEKNNGIAPFVNMTDVSIVMQWTSAVNEFYNSGSVKQIINMLSKYGQDIFKDDVKNNITNAFEKFNFAVNSNNLHYFTEAVEVIITAKNCLSENAPWYASDIIEYIAEDFTQRFNTADRQENGNIKYGELTIAIAKWYCDQGRYGDAAIALQEGIITYALEKFEKECIQFINKKITKNIIYTTKEILFKINVRELIRKHIFKTQDNFWTNKSWENNYREICQNLRNPAMKLHYNETSVKNYINIKSIQDAVTNCVNIMQKHEIDKDIQNRLNVLINKKEYDVFISYRRTYIRKSDGVLIANSLFNYLEKKGYRVFFDKDGLSDKIGTFNDRIKEGIANSEFLLIIFGAKALDRPLRYKNGKQDVFYSEILCATEYFKEQSENRILVCCMEKFTEENKLNMDLKRTDLSEDDKKNIKQIQKIAYEYERVGAKATDIWSYEALPMLEDEIVKLLEKKTGNCINGSTFVNYTNHRSSNWCNKQRQEAEKYGKICDIDFPDIPPYASAVNIKSFAEKEFKKILSYNPACVLCQGESTLSYYLINKLKKSGIKVVAACTERNVQEEIQNEEIIKTSKFLFRQFREY